MPSKHVVEKPGFFRKQLEDGAKSFRYRPGVRSLLGLSEVEDSLHFAQSLPPVDLSGLNPHLPNMASTPQGFSLRNKNTQPHESTSLQKAEQKGVQEKRNRETSIPLNKTSKFIVPQRPSEPAFKKPEVLKSERHRLSAEKIEQPSSLLGDAFSEKKNREDDAIPLDSPEKIQVDIPGCSKKKSSFPALSPFEAEVMDIKGESKRQPSQENPRAETTQTRKALISSISPFKNERASNTKNLEIRDTETDQKGQTAQTVAINSKDSQTLNPSQRSQGLHRPSTQQNSIRRKIESDETFPAQQASGAISSVLKTEAQIKEGAVIVPTPKENKANSDQKGQTAQTVAINLKDSQSINPSQQGQGLHRPSTHKNSILRKTVSGETGPTWHVSGDQLPRGRATPSVLHRETRRAQRPSLNHHSNENNATGDEQKNATEEIEQAVKPHTPQPAPIVIVKQTRPQNKTPSAFWERRYLSHAALKLRILR